MIYYAKLMISQLLLLRPSYHHPEGVIAKLEHTAAG
jgi:hypothetical protein